MGGGGVQRFSTGLNSSIQAKDKISTTIHYYYKMKHQIMHVHVKITDKK